MEEVKILKRLNIAYGSRGFRRIAAGSGQPLVPGFFSWLLPGSPFLSNLINVYDRLLTTQISLLNEVPRERKINIIERLVNFSAFALSNFYRTFHRDSVSRSHLEAKANNNIFVSEISQKYRLSRRLMAFDYLYRSRIISPTYDTQLRVCE